VRRNAVCREGRIATGNETPFSDNRDAELARDAPFSDNRDVELARDAPFSANDDAMPTNSVSSVVK
jgi:hypothetical protein